MSSAEPSARAQGRIRTWLGGEGLGDVLGLISPSSVLPRATSASWPQTSLLTCSFQEETRAGAALQGIGQEDTALSCAMRLDNRKISSLKGWLSIRTAWGRGGIAVPGNVQKTCECGTWVPVVNLAVLISWLETRWS